MKLYEITGQFIELDNMIPEIDNQQDAEAFTDLFNELQGELTEKVHGLCCVIRNTESNADALDQEIKRLTAKKKALQAKANRLTDYLEFNLRHSGVQSVKTSIFDVAIRKNPASVKVTDVTIIPCEFVRTKVEPDKVLIKEALKAGNYVPGCELEQTEKVVIK